MPDVSVRPPPPAEYVVIRCVAMKSLDVFAEWLNGAALLCIEYATYFAPVFVLCGRIAVAPGVGTVLLDTGACTGMR